MATCPACVKQIPENVSHCPYCGAQQTQPTADKKTMFGYAPSPAELQQMQQQAKAGQAAPHHGAAGALPAAVPTQAGGPQAFQQPRGQQPPPPQPFGQPQQQPQYGQPPQPSPFGQPPQQPQYGQPPQPSPFGPPPQQPQYGQPPQPSPFGPPPQPFGQPPQQPQYGQPPQQPPFGQPPQQPQYGQPPQQPQYGQPPQQPPPPQGAPFQPQAAAPFGQPQQPYGQPPQQPYGQPQEGQPDPYGATMASSGAPMQAPATMPQGHGSAPGYQPTMMAPPPSAGGGAVVGGAVVGGAVVGGAVVGAALAGSDGADAAAEAPAGGGKKKKDKGAAAGVAAAAAGEFKLSKIIPRVVKLFSDPRGFWQATASEGGGVGPLLPSVIVFSAIAAIATALGLLIMTGSIVGTILQLVIGAALNVGLWFLLSILINAFAKTFGGAQGMEGATKIAFGVSLPGWVASVLNIIPVGIIKMLVMLAAFGYGCFLLYLGVQEVNATPKEKAIGYTATVMGIYIVAAFVLVAIVGAVVAIFTVGSLIRAAG